MDRLLRQVEEPAEEQVEEATSDLLHLHQQQQVERVAMIPVQLVVQLVQPEAVETTMHANAVCTAATCAPWECHARLVKMDFALTQCYATPHQTCWIVIMNRLLRQVEEPAEALLPLPLLHRLPTKATTTKRQPLPRRKNTS